MNKFKVGDRVRVIGAVEDFEEFCGVVFDRQMRKHCGNEAIIIDVFECGNGFCYCLDIDNNCYTWAEDWLELAPKTSAKIKKLTSTAIIPTRATTGSAGYDLYADISEPIFIAPHTTEKIHTGIALTPPDGTAGFIFARSGAATKRGLAPANKVGVCDIDYTGEYIVALHNHTETPQILEVGERIAQLVFLPVVIADLVEVDSLDTTERGTGGFGSTGRK